jgi:hypothetical protein
VEVLPAGRLRSRGPASLWTFGGRRVFFLTHHIVGPAFRPSHLDRRPQGLTGEEGTFALFIFWLIHGLAEMGEIERAPFEGRWMSDERLTATAELQRGDQLASVLRGARYNPRNELPAAVRPILPATAPNRDVDLTYWFGGHARWAMRRT